MADPIKINGFVLAGGKSTRMGQDKAMLRLGNRPLVVRAIGILRPFVHEVKLLAPPNRYENLRASVVSDRWPTQGPLAAVCTGLLDSDAEWNLFLACDLPLISARLITLLINYVRATNSDAVVPRSERGWEPLAAAYHTRCQPAFLRAIDEGQRSVVGLLPQLKVDAITQDEMLAAGVRPVEFTNVNTLEDWERIKALYVEAEQCPEP